MPTLADPTRITSLLAPEAVVERGAFHLDDDEPLRGSDGAPLRTIVLLGWTGGQQWPAFRASPEATDGLPDPLDRWSRRLIDLAAGALRATPFYPFGGPPHRDFQGWALRAEPLVRSPVGLLAHTRWGLWHAYRGALGFPERLPLAPIPPAPNPCDGCETRPCLSTCPVTAFTRDGYDVGACMAHLGQLEGHACRSGGCAARRACPINGATPYPSQQASFHMRAFMRGACQGACPSD